LRLLLRGFQVEESATFYTVVFVVVVVVCDVVLKQINEDCAYLWLHNNNKQLALKVLLKNNKDNKECVSFPSQKKVKDIHY